MENSLFIGIQSQEKRFYTPDGLPLQIEKAPAQTDTSSLLRDSSKLGAYQTLGIA
jgi:hypothetical protein